MSTYDYTKADDAVFTVEVDAVYPMGALADEAGTDSVGEGDVGIPRMTLDRKLLTRIVGATDANRADVDGSGHLQIDIAAVSVTVPVSGTVSVTEPVTVDGTVDIGTIGAGDANIGNVDIVTLPGDVEADIDQIRDQIDLITPDIEEIRADVDNIRLAVEIMDDWDESDRAKVNPIVGQAGVQGGSGTVSANTQRVVLATDVALPAGNNNIGDVDIASIAAGNNNIGDVDIASIAAGDNNIGNVDIVTLPNEGQQTMANSISVAIASDQSAIPVTFPGDAEADIDQMRDDINLLASGVRVLGTDTYVEAASRGYVSGAVRRDADTTLVNTTNEFAPLQVDANGALKVEIFDGGQSHTVDNNGTFAVQVDGLALTALQLIDDPVFVDDAAFTVGTSKVMAAGHQAVVHGTNPDAADAGDAVIGITNRHRVPYVIGGHPNIVGLEYMTTGSQTNDPIIDSIGTGTKIVITMIEVLVDGDGTTNVQVRIGFGTASVPSEPSSGSSVTGMVLSAPDLKAGSGVVLGTGAGIVAIGGDDQELRITCESPTSGKITVMVHYYTIES